MRGRRIGVSSLPGKELPHASVRYRHQERLEHHGDRIIRRLERAIFPWLGGKPIANVTPFELLTVVQRIEKRGALETAHRALANCGQMFRYAVATGRAERDSTGDLRDVLPPVKGEHFAAITEPDQVGELLRTLDNYQGTSLSPALRFAPLVFVRPGALRKAEWAHIDLAAAEWRYIVTKTDTQYIVPLATQAVAILRNVHALTGTIRLPGRAHQRPADERQRYPGGDAAHGHRKR